MRFQVVLSLLCLTAAETLRAQVIITSADMFNEPGLYYRAYANANNAPQSVADRIGRTGGPQLWDFTTGSTTQVFRFDYLAATNVLEAGDFPDATLVERKTEEARNYLSYLFFTQEARLGRKVFGFWDEDFNPDNPTHVFDPPILDFPDQIKFGDTWTTATRYDTSIIGVPARLTHSSELKADAWGFVDLPALGFAEALRVNELSMISIAIDFEGDGNYTNVETDFVRNLYWLQPGRGIVAQMTSTQSTSPPADNFNLAAYFLRMFETNKKPTAGCTHPSPVNDLKISVSSGRALLKWTKSDCTSSYRVEFTSGGFTPDAWQVLGTTSDLFMLDDSVATGRARLYRVVSLR